MEIGHNKRLIGQRTRGLHNSPLVAGGSERAAPALEERLFCKSEAAQAAGHSYLSVFTYAATCFAVDSSRPLYAFVCGALGCPPFVSTFTMSSSLKEVPASFGPCLPWP